MMSDLILMHGENGKTFFVDKDEYLAHWEWKKPTKYIDKYEKNGKTVYVYENDYKDTKGTDDSRTVVQKSNSPTFTVSPTSGRTVPVGRANHYIDLRDNVSKAKEIESNTDTNDSVNDHLYYDARTGKQISAKKVNASAMINRAQNKVSDTVSKAREFADRKAEESKRAIQESVNNAQNAAKAQLDEVKEKVDDAVDKAKDTVAEGSAKINQAKISLTNAVNNVIQALEANAEGLTLAGEAELMKTIDEIKSKASDILDKGKAKLDSLLNTK